MRTETSRLLPDPGATFWVSLRYFSVTRLVVAAVLLIALIVPGAQPFLNELDTATYLRTAIAYAAFGGLFAYFAAFRHQRYFGQLGLQLALDMVALTMLMHSSGGVRGGVAVLYLLPIAGAAILSPSIVAIGFAAMCSLAILTETFFRELTSDFSSGSMLVAGLYGTASFAIALLMNRLAARVIAQERIAAERGRDLTGQIEINRLVVADMQDGVITVSDTGAPLALNAAATRMLHVGSAEDVLRNGWGDHAAGTEISIEFQRWRRSEPGARDTFELLVKDEIEGEPAHFEERLRVRFAAPRIDHESTGHVVFLEDLRRVEERAQQLKLASMGRLTASIAHEVRNPLAAISHASALLAEEQLTDSHRRLVRIISDNTLRLDRIIENVLQISRRGQVRPDSVDIEAFLDEVVSDFCRDNNTSREIIEIAVHERPLVSFNREHLHQVVVNLLQNALRYASRAANSIAVIVVPVIPQLVAEQTKGTTRRGDRIALIVQDDGPGIDRATRDQLFEPFFTTHHRGTGLGLYLARELCMANDAMLGFVPSSVASKKGGFVVNMAAMSTRSAPEAASEIETPSLNGQHHG